MPKVSNEFLLKTASEIGAHAENLMRISRDFDEPSVRINLSMAAGSVNAAIVQIERAIERMEGAANG